MSGTSQRIYRANAARRLGVRMIVGISRYRCAEEAQPSRMDVPPKGLLSAHQGAYSPTPKNNARTAVPSPRQMPCAPQTTHGKG